MERRGICFHWHRLGGGAWLKLLYEVRITLGCEGQEEGGMFLFQLGYRLILFGFGVNGDGMGELRRAYLYDCWLSRTRSDRVKTLNHKS